MPETDRKKPELAQKYVIKGKKSQSSSYQVNIPAILEKKRECENKIKNVVPK